MQTKRKPTSTITRLGSTVAIAAALLAVAMSCSLRQDDQPRAIPKDSLPAVLFQADAAASTTAPITPTTEPHDMFLVHNDGTNDSLVAVPVPVQPPELLAELPGTIVSQLVARPPVNDQLKSYIPTGTRVLKAVKHDTTLDVDLSDQFASVEGPGQRLAVAQIVFTATAIPGISSVRFSINGSPTAVPVDEKSAEVGEMIGRADFPKLNPSNASTTTSSDQPVTTITDDSAGTDTVPAPTP